MKCLALAVASIVALIALSDAHAQAFPSRPIRILIPFTAGSQTDLIARMIGPKLSENTGQQVVVDNRPGAGGIVAGGILVGATPDGHTLMLSSNAFAVSAALYTRLPYDSLKDVIGVGQVASVPLVLVVAPALGIKSVPELIALTKQNPGKILFGSAGIGSGTHMGGEQFKLAAAINVVHVPYKGTPEALVDTTTGRIQYWFSPTGPALPFIKEGRLLALAVTTAHQFQELVVEDIGKLGKIAKAAGLKVD